ncbi:hypothetical protein D210916BOD24_13900 [Alteromonas sp. D210916BOD_24]
MKPGRTALTLIPVDASSKEMSLVNESIAPWTQRSQLTLLPFPHYSCETLLHLMQFERYTTHPSSKLLDDLYPYLTRISEVIL